MYINQLAKGDKLILKCGEDSEVTGNSIWLNMKEHFGFEPLNHYYTDLVHAYHDELTIYQVVRNNKVIYDREVSE